MQRIADQIVVPCAALHRAVRRRAAFCRAALRGRHRNTHAASPPLRFAGPRPAMRRSFLVTRSPPLIAKPSCLSALQQHLSFLRSGRLVQKQWWWQQCCDACRPTACVVILAAPSIVSAYLLVVAVGFAPGGLLLPAPGTCLDSGPGALLVTACLVHLVTERCQDEPNG